MYILYSHIATKDTILECWGASTKHPDTVYHFDDFEKTEYVPAEWQIPQWIWECASRQIWPFHAEELAEYGFECLRMLKDAAREENKNDN
jgi:hypothetical protein